MRTILFDLDDTLFDHRHASLAALATIQSANAPLQGVELPLLEQVYRELLEATHLEVLAGKLTSHQARTVRWQQVFAHFQATLAHADAESIAYLARDTYLANRQVVAGTVEMLQIVRDRGFQIGIITNNMIQEQVEKLAHCGLSHLIDDMVTAEEAGIPKPAPRIFQMALARLESNAESTIMVGDSWASDVLGARGVGMRALWLNRYDEACPDPTLATEIRHLAEIPPLLL